MGKPCECRLCTRGRRIEATLERGDVQELRALVKELASELGETEADLEYKSVILDGSWPTAFWTLQGGLEQAESNAWMEWASEVETEALRKMAGL